MAASSDAHGRHKCAACFRQFNRMEHLVEHMRSARHSAHDPRCAVCGKHCRSFEALRDHLGVGASSLPKAFHCATAFAAQGCTLCIGVFPTAAELRAHRTRCQFSRTSTIHMSRLHISTRHHQPPPQGGGALALGCKMVGAGSDGTLDVCARVCVVDERENVLFETFVKPLIPVTHYRYEMTGILPEHLRDGMTVKQAQRRVQDLLLNGEQPWKVRTSRGRARVLVGHGLDHDLDALGMDYPAFLKRDTATYPPLMKTSKLSNSLRFLTQTYLGYDIQTGHQDPYEGSCVAAMRLYRRMRAQPHPKDDADAAGADQAFPAWRQRELERMTPEELLQISTPDYYCWCLDD
ncbi:RNA exonuclease 4-like [Phragmites australis]|uniref:RNA exonuclease 4-like n=1 Tax=Phragmites australis TaxID=29695 RepID=UPI002D7767A7|nr:RNA exonuclease 4-like [Phragmites australis]